MSELSSWLLLKRKADEKSNKAKCPYCSCEVEYSDNGCDYPPKNCPECGRPLDYVRKCPHWVGALSLAPDCKHRGSCYGCSVYKNAYKNYEEEYDLG